MRKLYITIVFILAIQQIFTQELIKGNTYSVPASKQEYHIDMVYHKITGENISQHTLNQLVDKNPTLYLESVYDRNGKIIRYYYDPNNQGKVISNPESTISSGDEFPPFSLNTIEENKIESEDLRGKLILLRFELHATDFRFKKHEIAELDDQINNLDKKDAVKAIIIFRENKKNIESSFPFPDSNFELVADGKKFFEKYRIRRYPMTALIDQDGNLISYFDYSEDIILENYIGK